MLRLISRTLPPLAWAGVIFFLSHRPASDYETTAGALPNFAGRDYMAHGILYFVLAILLFRMLTGVSGGARLWPAAATVAMAVLYGITDEYHQSFIPGRTGNSLDVVADGLGALAGVLAVILAERLWVGARPGDAKSAKTSQHTTVGD
ncbi:MAG: VanZ family protein [Dehalococcoidia bacterium]